MNDLNSAYKDLNGFINSQPKPLILAIEGMCASGKTTLANKFIKPFKSL